MLSEKAIVQKNTATDIAFALSLIQEDDPDRYQDIAIVLRRAAGRYAYLADLEERGAGLDGHSSR